MLPHNRIIFLEFHLVRKISFILGCVVAMSAFTTLQAHTGKGTFFLAGHDYYPFLGVSDVELHQIPRLTRLVSCLITNSKMFHFTIFKH